MVAIALKENTFPFGRTYFGRTYFGRSAPSKPPSRQVNNRPVLRALSAACAAAWKRLDERVKNGPVLRAQILRAVLRALHARSICALKTARTDCNFYLYRRCDYALRLIMLLIFLLSGMVSVAASQGPPEKKAHRPPSLVEEINRAKEEVTRANERAREAEAAAAVARAEAGGAKAEAAELQKSVGNLTVRVAELEEKLNRALAALDRLQQKDGAVDQKMSEVTTQLSSARAQIAATQTEVKEAQAAVEELNKNTKGAVTSGNAKTSFYGFIIANASFADSQQFLSDMPLWALPDGAGVVPPPINGQAIPGLTLRAGQIRETNFTIRQTRLGLRASLPRVGSWTPSTHVEIDFLGARPAVGQGSTFNQPRIRLAYVSLERAGGWRFVAGQDWIIFAPLNPVSFAHFASPEAASAGNPWLRFPQLRMEKTIRYNENTSLLIQGGVLRAVGGGDAPAAGSLLDVPALAGERAVHPFYQSRVAVTRVVAGKRNLTVGFSGHYGREDTGPNTIDTWAGAFDYVFPVHDKLSFTGEVWAGSNMDSFQAGIFQGAALVGDRFRKIDARGGWIQLGITPASKWNLNFGYGQDDPDNNYLNTVVNRAKNQLWWTNVMYKLHPNVTVALEYNYFDTIFKVPRTSPARVGTSNFLNLAFVYSF